MSCETVFIMTNAITNPFVWPSSSMLMITGALHILCLCSFIFVPVPETGVFLPNTISIFIFIGQYKKSKGKIYSVVIQSLG